MMQIANPDDLHYALAREFAFIEDRFEFFVLEHSDFRNPDLILAARPGTYVWWDGKDVVRIGVSLVNARARALDHIRDDTGGICGALAENQSARLVLFTLEPEDAHWAAALEVYLERVLSPLIPSKHLG